MQLGPRAGLEIHAGRRKRLQEFIKDGVAILVSAPESLRNPDVHFPFRQDSSFYYLTGFDEPESALIIDPSSPSPFTLFVREKDPTRELWDGFRYGLEGAQKYFGPNKVYPISEFSQRLPELIKNAEQVYYKINDFKLYDEIVFDAIEKARRLRGRTGIGAATIIDVKQVVGELRLVKGPEEVERLKKACEISAQGHIAGMKACKPGRFEFEIQAEIEKEFRVRGADRLGYSSIVGTGVNATVLHYIRNSDALKKEDFLLVDAGAEYDYLTGDITRTYPVSGRFTPAQKRFYESVLKVQKECVAMVKPGIKLTDIHAHAIDGLTEAMLGLGLLKGDKKGLIEKRSFFKYFPHGTSHWLGMDVHDTGLYSPKGEPRKLEPNMCFTVEPGLYVNATDTEAPAELRGFGVRIEDDVLVTSRGCEVLTSSVPKDVDQLEALIGKSV